jgi:dynactin 1
MSVSDQRPASTATKPALGHRKAPSITRTSSARSTDTSSRSASPLKTASTINPPPSPGPGRPGASSRQPLMSPSKRQTLTALSKSSLSRQSTLADGPLSPSPVVPARKLTLLQSKRPSSPLSQPPESSSTSSSPVTEPAPLQRGPKPRPSSSLTNELLTTSSPSPEPSTPPPVAVPPPAPAPAPAQDDAELQELRARVRVLEAKRADDARHVRELENRLNEAESFVALRPKLQAKLTSLQSDLAATKRELADAKQLSALGDNRTVDLQDQMEMAMLDKEMAEERAEVAETELEEVKEKLAVIEVELEVLKNGGSRPEDDEKEAGVKPSMAHIQLEKQNERLKEALMR